MPDVLTENSVLDRPQAEKMSEKRLRRAIVTSAVLALATAAFIVLYSRHPLLPAGAPTIIMLSVVFTLVIRLLIDVWKPILFGGGERS